MKNKLAVHIKSCAAKSGRRFLALLLSCVLIFGLSACGGQKTTGKAEGLGPVTVEREPEPQALQTANEATAIALRQYIYARLATEEFLTADASSMTMEELSELVDGLFLAWEKAALFSSVAEELTNQAILLLEAPIVKQTSAAVQPQAQFMTLAAVPMAFQPVALAAGPPKKLDPKTWAENLTKQFDALRGGQRYRQLAQQLGTDAKAACEQMALAQEIIRGQATADAAFWDKMTKIAQATKTASKVGLFVAGTIATGGGSLSALGASGWSLAQAGGCIVGGADCIVDIAATGSNIILGENHQVTVGFDDVKDKLAPVSAVVGLASFNPGETGEQLAYIGDTLTDWFFDGKVMGVQVDDRTVTARIFDSVGTEALKSALESAGYVFPETSRTLTEIMEELEADPEAALARMGALVSQMAELTRAAGITGEAPPEPGSAESTAPSESAENTPAGDTTIFGTYRQVSTKEFTGKANGEEGETEISTIIIEDVGGGLLKLIDEEYDDTTFLNYDPETNIVHNESAGITVHIEFSLSEGGVTGSGYIRGTLWGEPIGATLELTKISD